MKFTNIFPSQNNSLFSLQELKFAYKVLEEKIELDFFEGLKVNLYPAHYSSVINNWNKIILVPKDENIKVTQVELIKKSTKKYFRSENKNISKSNADLKDKMFAKNNNSAPKLINYNFMYSEHLNDNAVVILDRSNIVKEVFSNRNLLEYESWVGFDTSFVIKTGLNVFTKISNLLTYSSIIIRV
jgi:hypothetical protein